MPRLDFVLTFNKWEPVFRRDEAVSQKKEKRRKTNQRIEWGTKIISKGEWVRKINERMKSREGRREKVKNKIEERKKIR